MAAAAVVDRHGKSGSMVVDEFYALYQSGAAIYGVGRSPEAARDDARQWLKNPAAADAAQLTETEGDALDIRGNLYIRRTDQATYAAFLKEEKEILRARWGPTGRSGFRRR